MRETATILKFYEEKTVFVQIFMMFINLVKISFFFLSRNHTINNDKSVFKILFEKEEEDFDSRVHEISWCAG